MKYKNKYLITIASTIIMLFAFSCKDSFLEVQPKGLLGSAQMASPNGLREALIAAYADLGGQFNPNGFNYYAQPDNWLYGSICGGDAHKGSNAGDQAPALAIARFEGLPTNVYFGTKWQWVYDGIARSNLVMRLAGRVDMEAAEKANIIAQAHFLRGFYAFEAKKTWNKVPWIDTSVTYAKGNYQVPNDKDIYPMIEADFQYAYQNLPETQDAVGKANKWAAGAFLAKVYIFQDKYGKALPVLNDVITNGQTSNGIKYKLQPQFDWNFNFHHQNSSESIFAIQSSLNDGSGGFHGRHSDMLNFPYGNGAVTGCCGFYQPSIELVNAYRTGANGLPMLDGTYASPEYDLPANAVKNDQGILSTEAFTPDQGKLDPRVDWTAGRRGIPYLDWGMMQGKYWIRDQASAGPYSPKKNVFYKADIGSGGDNAKASWAPLNATNYTLIRFAQVLLWAAECEIEVGSLSNAQNYVNMVRNRAANPDGFVKKQNGDPAANYYIKPYPAGWFTAQGKDMAWKAVRLEEKLELAMEGHRFFDLVRWGIADKVMNHYFDYESQFTSDIDGAQFTANKNEYFPIPQTQIDLSGGTLTQNQGYR